VLLLLLGNHRSKAALAAAAAKGGLGAEGTQHELARQDWALDVVRVGVCISDGQYAGAQALAEYLEAAARGAAHHYMRPRCRPHAGEQQQQQQQQHCRACQQQDLVTA
jgi:hypothetical protein